MSGHREKTESDKRCLDVRNRVDALLKPLGYEVYGFNTCETIGLPF